MRTSCQTLFPRFITNQVLALIPNMCHDNNLTKAFLQTASHHRHTSARSGKTILPGRNLNNFRRYPAKANANEGTSESKGMHVPERPELPNTLTQNADEFPW
jgi:hypothetical protein